jgi:hypothetical protein
MFTPFTSSHTVSDPSPISATGKTNCIRCGPKDGIRKLAKEAIK